MEHKILQREEYFVGGPYSDNRTGVAVFDLDVFYHDYIHGPEEVTLDALQVYKDLKEFFKGTEYE